MCTEHIAEVFLVSNEIKKEIVCLSVQLSNHTMLNLGLKIGMHACASLCVFTRGKEMHV